MHTTKPMQNPVESLEHIECVSLRKTDRDPHWQLLAALLRCPTLSPTCTCDASSSAAQRRFSSSSPPCFVGRCFDLMSAVRLPAALCSFSSLVVPPPLQTPCRVGLGYAAMSPVFGSRGPSATRFANLLASSVATLGLQEPTCTACGRRSMSRPAPRLQKPAGTR